MAKKTKNDPNRDQPPTESGGAAPKMKRKEYEAEMERLQGELVAMQEWVKASGAKVCIVFEGRDTAGKGGTIKRITERVSPRVFRIAALPAPTPRERSQMYIQRYVQHFPAAGEVVIFDRSWYNRAGVEPVMGFCTPAETAEFLDVVPLLEKQMTQSGIVLIKYWLEVSQEEQTRRLKGRINDPRKIWKLSDMDLQSYGKWYDYSRARDAMFAATDTDAAPWHVARQQRQEAGPPEHHHPPADPGALRAPARLRRQAAQTPASRRLHRAGAPQALHPDPVLRQPPDDCAQQSDPAHRSTSPTPTYDRPGCGRGIVHIGVGGFHRAHQAMYVDALLESGDQSAYDWGICGVGVLHGDARMRDALVAQDGLYTLVLKDPDGSWEPRVIGSIMDYLLAPDDPEAVIEQMAAETTRIVSLTVTEGGYNVHPVTGEFDATNPAVLADLDPGATPQTSVRPGHRGAGPPSGPRPGAVHGDVLRQHPGQRPRRGQDVRCVRRAARSGARRLDGRERTRSRTRWSTGSRR